MAESKFFSTSKFKKLKSKGKASGSINGASALEDNMGTKKKKKVFKRLGAGAGVLAVIGLILFVVAYIFAIRPAYALLSNVNSIKKDISQIKENATKRDLVALEEDFNSLENNLKEFQKDRDEKIGWAKDFGPTKEYYADSDRFVAAGLHMINAGRKTLDLMVPFADAGGFKISEEQEVEETGLAEAFSKWVAIMPQIAQDLDPVLQDLTLAGEELAQVDASKYPENFRGQPIRQTIEGAQKSLVLVNDAAPDIKKALTIIPELLGVDTAEKRYMILMANDKELRANGGFWTYLSTFKVNNALLTSDFTSYGTYNVDFALDVIDPYYTFPTVPAAYQRHLKVERLYARDANLHPDFTQSVDEFMTFWELAQPLAPAQFKPVDGVVSIDTVVLEELLEVTGPVVLNGVTYSSDTVTLELEKIASLALREQANRKKVLGDLMEAMLINVFESEKNLWPKLIEKGIDLALRKHIQAYVFEPEAQLLLEKYNFAGRVIDPGENSDYAMAVSINLGGGKTDGWFVNKDVKHSLAQEDGRWVRTVTATYTYGELGPEFDPFIVPSQNWVRLYVPLGSELISSEGSLDPVGTSEDAGKTVFDGFVRLSQGETKAITFKYYLPEGVVGEDRYNLYIQKQAGIDTEKHTVSVDGKEYEVILDLDQKFSTDL